MPAPARCWRGLRLSCRFSGFSCWAVSRPAANAHPPKILVLGGAALCLLAVCCFLLLPSLRGYAIHDLDPQKFAWNAALNFGVTLCLAPAFLFSVHRKSGSADRFFGDASYVLYCSHWIAVLVAAHYLAGLPMLTKAPMVVALLFITYCTSFFLTLFVDRPIGRWREGWVSRNLRGLVQDG